MCEPDLYEIEVSEIRDKINEIDRVIIDFIFAISEKIKFTIDGNKFTLGKNLSYEYDHLLNNRDWEAFVETTLRYIYQILAINDNSVNNVLIKGLENSISKRFALSLDVAELKFKYEEEILDIKRRDTMIENRASQGEQYSLQEKLAKIFRYIHDKSCELQGTYFWFKNHIYDINKLREKLKEN